MAYLLNGGGGQQEQSAQQESVSSSGGQDDALGRAIRKNTGAGSGSGGGTSDSPRKSAGGTNLSWRDLTPEELANLPPEERDRMLSDTSVHKLFKGLGDFITYPARQANRE